MDLGEQISFQLSDLVKCIQEHMDHVENSMF